MSSNPGMNSGAARPAAPAIMRIGAARLTAGLDRYPRLDLEAHRDLFGRLPRLSDGDIFAMAQQVDLRGHGGAAFPFARKLKAVVDAAHKKDQPTIVVVNATEGEPGSFKDKMLLMRSPYLILSGAALAAEAIGAEEIVIGVASNELANRSLEAAVAAEPGLRDLVRIVEVPERFISGESGALVRAINGKTPIPPGRKTLAAESGVYGLPTLLSNAETYAQLAVLALLGPERYASVGMPEEPGTVLLSVSGSAARPAVVEVPPGVPLGSVLDICQAPAGDGVLVGGYHGMWLPAENAYVVPVSRSGMEAVGGTLGAGIVLPLGGGTEARGVARRSSAAVSGRGACAHPDGTTRFVLSALDVFTEDLAAHVFHSSCGRPVRGVLPLPTGPEVQAQQRLVVDWTRCDGHGLCAHLVPEIVHLDSTGYPVMLDIPVPDWLEKDAQQAVDMCPALALRLASKPAKGNRGPAPVPLPMPTGRTALIGGSPSGPAGGRGGRGSGPRQITAG